MESHTMAKRKTTTKAERILKEERKRGKDDTLIALCVEYAQNVAAIDAGFAADPDGNSKFAEGGRNFWKQAMHALESIGRISATTVQGLSAKARIVPAVIKEGDGIMEDASSTFFLSLARDVRAFVEPAISKEFAASLTAERAVQSH